MSSESDGEGQYGGWRAWCANGPENRAPLCGDGSIPSPSANKWATPSLVTERVCKTCGLCHAAFDSPVTHHLADVVQRQNARAPLAVTRVRTLVVRTKCPVSKSGDCAALKAQKRSVRIQTPDTNSGRPLGRSDPLQERRAGFDSQIAPPIIPVNRLGGCGLTVNRDAAGSNPATGANLPRSSTGQASGFSARQHGIDTHTSAPVSSRSSTGRAPGYERGGCRFDSCREGQSSGCRGAQSSPPALEAGDRWFESTHPDHLSRLAQWQSGRL